MVLQRWYPLASRRTRHDPMERLLRSFFAPAGPAVSADRVAPLDVRETEEAIVVTASLPGVAPEDIDVTIEDRVPVDPHRASRRGRDRQRRLPGPRAPDRLLAPGAQAPGVRRRREGRVRLRARRPDDHAAEARGGAGRAGSRSRSRDAADLRGAHPQGALPPCAAEGPLLLFAPARRRGVGQVWSAAIIDACSGRWTMPDARTRRGDSEPRSGEKP